MVRSYVVTGGGRGVGRSIVERLLDDGHAVVTIDRDASALQWTDGHRAGRRLVAVAGDASDEATTDDAAVFRDASLHDSRPTDVLDLVVLNLGLCVTGCATAVRRLLAAGPPGQSSTCRRTFGMWWTYFLAPSAEILEVHRKRAFVWGYGNILIFSSIVATGAGLHVAASYIGHEAHVGATATVLTVAVPLAVFVFAVYGLYTYLVHAGDPFHLGLLAATVAVLVAAVWLATMGVPMAICLVVLMLAPVVTVVGYETIGHRHQAALLERTLAR